MPGSRDSACLDRLYKVLPLSALFLGGCRGPQSALEGSGPAASEIAALWWWMFGASIVIFLIVLVLLLHATFVHPERRWKLSSGQLIVGGGIIFPVVVLTLLLPLGINVGSSMHDPTDDATPTIEVTAYQWWWGVEYQAREGKAAFTTANEIYIPVGQPVELLLESRDVIHSFWVPRLAGKLDMVPGSTNRLVVEATEPGTFRGQCAEYCGEAHTQMAFHVVALPPEEFEAWADRQRQPQPARLGAEHPGAEVFRDNGCGLCHTVRGHDFHGREAPDLTHVGSRMTIGAGLLENNSRNIAHWLANNDKLKPGNLMPEYKDIDLGDRMAIGDYLERLE